MTDGHLAPLTAVGAAGSPGSAFDETVARLSGLLHGCRFDLSDEKRLQGQIGQVLDRAGVEYVREVRLSARDYPDFVVDGVAIECKLRGHGKREIHRQLARYAACDAVGAVMLVTNVAMGLPETIEGKPAFFFSLGRGWL